MAATAFVAYIGRLTDGDLVAGEVKVTWRSSRILRRDEDATKQ